MSRTHVHAPWHVTEKDPYFMARPWYRLCGCRMCSGRYDRKMNRQIDRMRQRELLAKLSKMSRQDMVDYDPYLPRANKWAATVGNWYPLKEQKPR